MGSGLATVVALEGTLDLRWGAGFRLSLQVTLAARNQYGFVPNDHHVWKEGSSVDLYLRLFQLSRLSVNLPERLAREWLGLS